MGMQWARICSGYNSDAYKPPNPAAHLSFNPWKLRFPMPPLFPILGCPSDTTMVMWMWAGNLCRHPLHTVRIPFIEMLYNFEKGL